MINVILIHKCYDFVYVWSNFIIFFFFFLSLVLVFFLWKISKREIKSNWLYFLFMCFVKLMNECDRSLEFVFVTQQLMYDVYFTPLN